MTTKTLAKTTATGTEFMTFMFTDAATNAEFGVRVLHEESFGRGAAAVHSDGRLTLTNARKWWREAIAEGFKAIN